MAKKQSKTVPILVTLSVLTGGGIIAYYALKTPSEDPVAKQAAEDAASASEEGFKTTTTTTTTTETSSNSSTSSSSGGSGGSGGGSQAGGKGRPGNAQRDKKEKEQQDAASTANSEEARRQAASGVIINKRIKFNDDFTLLNYKKSADFQYPTKDSYGNSWPLNKLYFSDILIDRIVPHLGLATDLVDDEGKYPPLSGIIGGEPVARSRKQNIAKIKDCLGLNDSQSLKSVKEDTREKLALLIYNVVCATDMYWETRKDVAKQVYEDFSEYKFEKGKPTDRKKRADDIENVKKRLEGLFELDKNILEKQRVAANALWAVVQASDDQNTGDRDAAYDDKPKPDMFDPNSRLKAGMIEALSHIQYLEVPKAPGVSVTNRYYRAVVDAFFDGCFNCEVPGVRAMYLDRTNKNKKFRDAKLKKQANLCICNGLVFHANSFPQKNPTK